MVRNRDPRVDQSRREAVQQDRQHGDQGDHRAHWRRSQATKGKDPVVLDIDASLVEIHSMINSKGYQWS